MPEHFVTVYLRDTGEPAQMHSVDAAEALRIGDYVSEPPYGHEPSRFELANVKARAMGIGASTHPELMTPDQREAHRREAREAAALLARPVVVQAVLPVQPGPPVVHQPVPLVPHAGPGDVSAFTHAPGGPAPQMTQTTMPETIKGADVDVKGPAVGKK